MQCSSCVSCGTPPLTLYEMTGAGGVAWILGAVRPRSRPRCQGVPSSGNR